MLLTVLGKFGGCVFAHLSLLYPTAWENVSLLIVSQNCDSCPPPVGGGAIFEEGAVQQSAAAAAGVTAGLPELPDACGLLAQKILDAAAR